MRRILSFFICLSLLLSCAVPVRAAEDGTQSPAETTAAEDTSGSLGIVTIPGLESGAAVHDAMFKPTYKKTGIPAVALTFDDGPGEESTKRILDVLEENQVPATFFLVGQNCKLNPDAMKRMVSLGCELGSHTYTHTRMTDLTEEQQLSEYTRSIEAIEKYSGGEATLFRPPFGSLSHEMRLQLDLPIILWSLDTLDWKTRDADTTVKNIQIGMRKAGGDIILMHDIHNETADAVERIVPWLIENGYKILTVSQLYDYYEEDLSLHMGHAYAGDPESAPADSDASDSSEDPEEKDAEEDTED